MPACKPLGLSSESRNSTGKNGFIEGRRRNGQKMFVKVITGTAFLTGFIGMHQLFRRLAAEQPGNRLLQW